MVFWAAGLEMMLVAGVSRRMLPLLERHMRDADCVGGVPPGACVLVAQSEQDGGVGGTEGSDTGRKFITVLFGGARSMRPDCDGRGRERCSPSVGIPAGLPVRTAVSIEARNGGQQCPPHAHPSFMISGYGRGGGGSR